MPKELEQLKNIFNLSTYEAKLYLASLNFSQANLTDLARKAGIPRTAAYSPLQALLKQGFVSAVKIKKRTYYSATNPKKLGYILERKQVELKNMVQTLEKKIEAPESKLSIGYYRGQNGVELASDILLEEDCSKKAKSWEASGGNIQPDKLHQLQDYIDRRVNKGIFGEMIVSADPDDRALKSMLSKDREELRRSLIVNPKNYPIKSAIAVLGDSVLILTWDVDPFAILIKNRDIATTLWSIHSMFWDRYEN